MARELAKLFDDWGRSEGWDWTDTGDPSDPGDFRPGGGGDPFGPGGPLNPNTLHPAPDGPKTGGDKGKGGDKGDDKGGNKGGGGSKRYVFGSPFNDEDDDASSVSVGDASSGWHGQTFDYHGLSTSDLTGDKGFGSTNLGGNPQRGGFTGPPDTSGTGITKDTVVVPSRNTKTGRKTKGIDTKVTAPDSTTPDTTSSDTEYVLTNTNQMADSLAREGLTPADATLTTVDTGPYRPALHKTIPPNFGDRGGNSRTSLRPLTQDGADALNSTIGDMNQNDVNLFSLWGVLSALNRKDPKGGLNFYGEEQSNLLKRFEDYDRNHHYDSLYNSNLQARDAIDRIRRRIWIRKEEGLK